MSLIKKGSERKVGDSLMYNAILSYETIRVAVVMFLTAPTADSSNGRVVGVMVADLVEIAKKLFVERYDEYVKTLSGLIDLDGKKFEVRSVVFLYF